MKIIFEYLKFKIFQSHVNEFSINSTMLMDFTLCYAYIPCYNCYVIYCSFSFLDFIKDFLTITI